MDTPFILLKFFQQLRLQTNCVYALLSAHFTCSRLHYTVSCGSTHLVRFALAHAGAHSIHPQVGVQVVRAQTCVRVHHFCHRHGRHGHCSHAAVVHIKEYSITMPQKKPNPSGKQHPPHIRRVTERTLKKN